MPHRPRRKTTLRPQHLLPLAVVAVAMLSYFAHLVSEAVQRGADARALASMPSDGAPTIAFAPHAVPARR